MLALVSKLSGCAWELQEVGPVFVRIHERFHVLLVLFEAVHVRVEIVDYRKTGRHVLDFDITPPSVLLPQIHEKSPRLNFQGLDLAGSQTVLERTPGVSVLVLGLHCGRRFYVHPRWDGVRDLVSASNHLVLVFNNKRDRITCFNNLVFNSFLSQTVRPPKSVGYK